MGWGGGAAAHVVCLARPEEHAGVLLVVHKQAEHVDEGQQAGAAEVCRRVRPLEPKTLPVRPEAAGARREHALVVEEREGTRVQQRVGVAWGLGGRREGVEVR